MSGKMKQEPQTVARRKVVVRNLPPLVSEADVKAVIEAAAAGKYDWFRFLQGKAKTSKIKPARAFLHFIDPRDVLSFKTHMEKHTFVNERGQVFQCIVEFAPSQEMPVPQKKRDRRENTLDKDEDFLHFVEAYEKELNDTTSMLKVQKFGVPNPGSGAPSTVPLKSNLMLALENRLPRSRGIIREYVNENAQSAQQSKPLKPEVSGSHPKKAAPKAEARPAVLRPPSGQREAVSSKSTRESSTEGARSQGVEPERRAERVRRVKEGAQVYVPRALRGDTQASGGASTPAKDSAADANMNGMMKAPGNRSEAQGLAPLIAGASGAGDKDAVASAKPVRNRLTGPTGTTSRDAVAQDRPLKEAGSRTDVQERTQKEAHVKASTRRSDQQQNGQVRSHIKGLEKAAENGNHAPMVIIPRVMTRKDPP